MKKTKFIIISVLVVISILVCSIIFINNKGNNEITIDKASDSSDFVLLSDAVPDAILEIRYYSTYNFVGDRIDGYEEPCNAMLAHGFKPLDEEWWHFTLKDEPFPDTYFTFPVTSKSIK